MKNLREHKEFMADFFSDFSKKSKFVIFFVRLILAKLGVDGFTAQ